MPAIDVRRAGERMHTEIDWLDSWHSFSFGGHYDPANTHHGLLLVLNDDTVAPGGGFGAHPHRDMEIVSWVLEGALEHRDSTGTHGVITPGLAQRMSAGSGIRHSEMNASRTEPVHFLQMWVPPDTAAIEPGYEQRDVSAALEGGDPVPIASGRDPEAAIHLHQRDATLWVARLAGGAGMQVPDAPFVHVFVARGAAVLDDGGSDGGNGGGTPLATGDAARLTAAGALSLRAADGGAEVVVWETWSDLP